ncbi:MAG: rhomboid family intramembrane serine protease [bacterium]
MIILPTSQGLSWKNVPIVTILIILINVCVFSFYQVEDLNVHEGAVDTYLELGLGAVEVPAFNRFLVSHSGKDQQQDENLKTKINKFKSTDLSRNLVYEMQSVPEFVHDMHQGKWLELDEQTFKSWEKDRATFEQQWNAGFNDRYYLKYDTFSVSRLFAHQFMHGSFMHLFGNMLILALLGVALEGAVGTVWFVIIYLGGGLISGLGSLMVNWGDISGGLGASGAIAGLMGAYATVFAMRKMRFFYWAFVYFGYFTAPALLVLPIWISWELLQWSVSDAHIAYDAHAFGLLGGAFMGWLSTRFGSVNHAFVEQAQYRDKNTDLFEQARKDLAALRVDTAREAFKQLVESDPNERDYQLQWFRTCVIKNKDDQLHQSARKLMLSQNWDMETHVLLHREFQQYLKASKGKIKFSIAELTRLAKRFVECDELEGAEKILSRLLKALHSKGKENPELEMVLVSLAKAYKMKGKMNQFRDLRSQILQVYPSCHLLKDNPVGE